MASSVRATKIIFVLLLLALTGCAQMAAAPVTSTPAPSPQSEPSLAAAVVMAAAEALNEGDLARALACWSDQATIYLIGLPPNGVELVRGRQAIAAVLAQNIAGHGRVEFNIETIRDNVVETQSLSWHDFTRQHGIAPLKARGTHLLKDGKIDTYAWILTEKSANKLKDALAVTMPLAAAPDPNEMPGSDLKLTFAGQTCHSDGPHVLRAGHVRLAIDVRDQERQQYTVTLYTLDPAKDIIDLLAATAQPQPQPPPWAKRIWAEKLQPGTSERFNIRLPEGQVYIICWTEPPPIAIGSIGPLWVRD
jgi:limonene-1,2-epoxide hydrolase